MTLVEMMVAVLVLLTMSMVVYETLSASIEFNEVLSMRDGTTRSARATLAKLRRELELAYLTPARNSPNTIQTVFVGFDEEPDKLHFTTLAHQRLYRDSRESDQAEITVWAESAPRDVGEGYVLYHRESPRVDHEPGLGGRVYPLAYNVRSFSVRYLDPQQQNEWRDDWDTRNSETFYRLPRAVEIGLVLIAADPEDPERTVDVPFLSRFTLVYAQRLMQNFVSLGQVSGGSGDATGQPAQTTNTQPLPPLGGGPGFAERQGQLPTQNRRGTTRNQRGATARPSTPVQRGRGGAGTVPSVPMNIGGRR
jgi:general secretion pathway protein J